jgi:class 3 adenylate cyclase
MLLIPLQVAAYRALAAKKQPPGKAHPGKAITLVLTDVEGSTELWEWDTEVMSQSIDLHDR